MDPTTRAAIEIVNANDVLSAKVIGMVVLGLSSFLLGILPMRLTKYVNVKNVDGDKNLLISLLMCFGGGVLLFTTFIHIQPEVREGFAVLKLQNKLPEIWGNLPISEIVLCAGLLLVYFIEEVAHKFLHNKVPSEVLHRSLSMRCTKKDSQIAIPRVTLNKFDDGNISCITTSNKQLLNSQSTINIEPRSSGHHHHFHGNLKKSFSGLLAVLALSFHAVFEGLAVGLESSEEKVWYLFLAIATHKLVIAFCVGIELVTSETKATLTILYIGIFSIVTPLGIGAGLLLTEGANEVNLIALILQGMAAGTLLYVVFFEVLARERNNDHCGIYQLLSIILGFILMAGLQIMTGHSHGSHQHGHEHPVHHHHHHEDMRSLT
ncbi:zinc transporter ZIP1-like [Coccinella septempunctata]|uniref:zinc transporter ZIP1-like n=1 Tax=Coccinella septempunctata TaxID=41139 RepID=UPI001D0736BD|nr:zinc transporter ZIP1-like [Coccinella septempunctata]XP_044764310.1 zinc transporter ZIP1-like [Coccinella septempunctata]XP_044764317.1 zinc transporter ZIP1-like [Coccinella septempunctata]XP_044764324.1 zinc transporter ZIP1-like [Coccinella septempunctata]XP_044764329.1 zinc transporter ZIP1-like [Coccinella septempunctata]